jgi:pyrroline-5-carboxylate reductase
MKISFIGGGNMGEAILAALLRKKVVTPDEINVSDVDTSRLNYLYEKYGINALSSNRISIKDVEVVVLAVKPQILPVVMKELKGQFKQSQLVISIIAGVGISKLRNGLDHRKIVRSMPNTPSQISEGLTVWMPTHEVTKAQKGTARAIIRVMGPEIEVNDEKYIDMATAVSGSGPAYIFYFIELLIKAAEKLGFNSDIAETLAKQTIIGAVHLMQKSDKTPAELRRAVTSPGGTTAAAIKVLDNEDFPGLIDRAVAAAYNRAKELGS